MKLGRIPYMVILALFIGGFTNTKAIQCENGKIIDGVCTKVIANEAVKVCEEGYSLSPSGRKCYKAVETESKVVKACSEGYTQVGDKCYSEEMAKLQTVKACLKGDDVKNLAKEKGYTVGSGDVLVNYNSRSGSCDYQICSNDSCTISVRFNDKPTTTKACPSGYNEVMGKCQKLGNTYWQQKCDEGYTLKNNVCVKYEEIPVNNVCEKGFSFNDRTQKCEKIVS